jgi:hypothetical protein
MYMGLLGHMSMTRESLCIPSIQAALPLLTQLHALALVGALSPGYCPYDACAVGGDWACPQTAPGDVSGGADGGASALPGDVTATPAALGCDVVPIQASMSPAFSGQ